MKKDKSTKESNGLIQPESGDGKVTNDLNLNNVQLDEATKLVVKETMKVFQPLLNKLEEVSTIQEGESISQAIGRANAISPSIRLKAIAFEGYERILTGTLTYLMTAWNQKRMSQIATLNGVVFKMMESDPKKAFEFINEIESSEFFKEAFGKETIPEFLTGSLKLVEEFNMLVNSEFNKES